MQEILKGLAFLAGAAGEIYLLMKGKFKKTDFWFIGIFSAFCLISIYSGDDINFGEGAEQSVIIVLTMLTSFLLIVTAYDRIIPLIDESVVLFWGLLFWYTYLVNFGFPSILNPFNIVLLVLSIFVILSNFIKEKTPNFLKILMYLFYIGSLIFVMLYMMGTYNGGLRHLANSADFSEFSYFSFLFSGMASVYIILSIMTILNFLPREDNSVKQHIKNILKQFHNYQTNKTSALALIFGLGSLMALNYFFRIINPFLFINIIIISVPRAIYFYRKNLAQEQNSK